MTIKEFFSFKTNRYFWMNVLVIVAIACMLIFGVLKGIDVYTQHGESVLVPSVKGMTEDEARMMLRNRGLDCMVVDSTYEKGKPSGCILEQNPAEGQHVKGGRTIYLTINSLNIPMITLPDVADNGSVRQATAKLISAGFKLTADEPVNGDKDWVYGVKLNGRQLMIGEKVPTGATLTLMVGNGVSPVVEQDSTLIDENANTETGTEQEKKTTSEESWF